MEGEFTFAPMADHKPPTRHGPVLDLIGGNVCLDFINTLDDRPSKNQMELLKGYSDLARFGEQTGILSRAQTDELLRKAALAPDEAEDVLLRARSLREALYEIFSALMHHKKAPAIALEILNQNLQEAALRSHLVQAKNSCEWHFDDLASSLDAVLWPIARTAAVLLTSNDVALVRACLAPNCQWFFLDTSKNHRRRWCDMSKCGNRAKVRSFYARKRNVMPTERNTVTC